MFKPVDGNVNFPEQELAVGRFWKERDIYRKSLEVRAGAPPFVFYEGPPTANGMPHPGHCLTRAIKDLFPRYHTMRGRFCERKAGWDTHGLPVEVEVCKELGIHSKEEIEAFGIEPFIQKCQSSVWRYMQEWERLTDRLGFWVDMEHAYATYHQSYVESVWWSLKNLFDRGLLYQGHKIVWWWAQGGTALSAGEVGQGYRQVADPSVYVKFPLLDDAGNVTDTSLLVWTTTPWTLPSNQFVAINPKLQYDEVLDLTDSTKTSKLIIATNLSHDVSNKALSAKSAAKVSNVKKSYSGTELIGKRYVPPFDWYHKVLRDVTGSLKGSSDELYDIDDVQETQPLYWRVVAADFVTTDSGTGLVHLAPAFGEDDFNVLLKERDRFKEIALRNPTPSGTQLSALDRPELQCPVDPNGKFNEKVPDPYRGRWVKDCDRDIIRDLKQRGLLFHQEQYVHDYPFCWRAEEDPLIQYPRESWFIRTTKYKDQMLANNAEISWLPEHIKDGRFGNFLASNVDWALSRERYWGTPLPIWKCDKTGQMEAIANYDELLAKPGLVGQHVWHDAKKKSPDLADDLQVHKPYIDALTYDSPFAAGARMHRVPEVIDCWYDSGAMPFAQWGYPKLPGSRLRFEGQFPADFISEAIDQTRGWFYSQLAISTLLFGKAEGGGGKSEGEGLHPSALPLPPWPHPFRNCIVLGLMLGEDGQKMSKSKRNYLAPDEIFDRYGADALRWYFFANQPPWTSIRYSEQAIKDSIPEFLLRLWNCYSFFVIYANIDGFDPGVELAATTKELANLDAASFADAGSYRPIANRSELDRWILSELHRTCVAVCDRMDAYDNFAACAHITEFVDALSNWYVRRSRDRLWAADKRAAAKLDAYWTLYECLVTAAKLVAPFVPFLAETLWQNLAGVFQAGSQEQGAASDNPQSKIRNPKSIPTFPLPPSALRPAESVHLTDYPTGDASHIDEALSARMNLVREISSLGRNARSAASLKVRQPLAKVEVVLADTTHQKWLEEHADLIAEELNVKQVAFTTRGEDYITYAVVPNFKRLGPRLGKNMPAAKKLLAEIDAGKLLAELKSAGKAPLNFPDGTSIDLDNEDIEVRLQAKPGWAAAQGKGSVVVLSTELTPHLINEGLARDFVRVVQDRRKEIGCDFTDRVELGVVSDSIDFCLAVQRFENYIKEETLAVQFVVEEIDGVIPFDADIPPLRTTIGGHTVDVFVRVMK